MVAPQKSRYKIMSPTVAVNDGGHQETIKQQEQRCGRSLFNFTMALTTIMLTVILVALITRHAIQINALQSDIKKLQQFMVEQKVGSLDFALGENSEFGVPSDFPDRGYAWFKAANLHYVDWKGELRGTSLGFHNMEDTGDCNVLKENGLGDKWCEKEKECTFLLSSQDNDKTRSFPYFTNFTFPSQNFDESIKWLSKGNEGRMKILVDGLYIIHSKVHFLQADSPPSYKILVERDLQTILIGECTAEPDQLSHELAPCQKTIPYPLRADDVVYLAIQTNAWFKVSLDNLTFGLIELNQGIRV